MDLPSSFIGGLSSDLTETIIAQPRRATGGSELATAQGHYPSVTQPRTKKSETPPPSFPSHYGLHFEDKVSTTYIKKCVQTDLDSGLRRPFLHSLDTSLATLDWNAQ